MINKSLSLDQRKARFRKLFENNKFKKVKSLLAFNRLSGSSFLKLQMQCLNFLIASYEPNFLKKNIKKKTE